MRSLHSARARTPWESTMVVPLYSEEQLRRPLRRQPTLPQAVPLPDMTPFGGIDVARRAEEQNQRQLEMQMKRAELEAQGTREQGEAVGNILREVPRSVVAGAEEARKFQQQQMEMADAAQRRQLQ